MKSSAQPNMLEVGYEITWSAGLGASGQNISLAVHVQSENLQTLSELKHALKSLRIEFDHKNLYRDFPEEIKDGSSLTQLATFFLARIKKTASQLKIHRLELKTGSRESAIILN